MLVFLTTLSLFAISNFNFDHVFMENACLEKYIDKLDELLTEPEIRSVYTDIPESTVYEYSRYGSVAYHQCQYEWPSDRFYIMDVSGQKVKVDKPNKLGVGRLHTYKDRIDDPIKYFRNAHQTPLEEDLIKLREMEERKMTESELTATQKKMGSDLTTSLAGQISFTNIDDLGDAAAWDHMNSSLSVLIGRTEFEVYVEISEDYQENLRLAKQLVEIILAKC